MNDIETNKAKILNLKIFFHSIKASATHLIWPIGGIGIPAIYFGFEGNLLEMAMLFSGCFVVITALYVIACILVTKVKLSDKAAASKYLQLSDEDKGKQIADTLIGW